MADRFVSNVNRILLLNQDGSTNAYLLKIYLIPSSHNQEYRSQPDELQFFADNDGQLLVFETINWKQRDLEDITGAITWYAQYIGNPSMEISIDPKRFGITLI